MTRQTQTWFIVIGIFAVGMSVIGMSALGMWVIGISILGVFVIRRSWRGSRQQRSRVLSVALVAVLALAYTLGATLGRGVPISHAATDLRPMPTHSFNLAPTAKGVAAHWSSTVAPRSAAETTTLRANLAKMRSLRAPKLSMSSQKAVDPASLNRPMAAPARQRSDELGVPTGPFADSDPVREQYNLTNGNGTGAAYPCTLSDCSPEASPSVAGFGRTLMESYNWYDSLSSDGGTTWSYLNPFTQFTGLAGVGSFCCDQQVLYEPSRSSLIWEQLYGPTGSNPEGVGLAAAAGTNLSSWCFFYLTAASLGFPNTDQLGFPDIEYTNDNLFLSFNLYANGVAWVGSGVLRIPLTAMSSCTGFAAQSYLSTANFQYALTQGAQGTMWFVSDAYISGSGGTTGSSLNICQWQDPQSSPSCVDRAIPAFTYLVAGNANCGSQDGVVTNWCTNLDSSARSAFFTKANFRGFGPATLGVALTVGPAGSDPFPSVAIYYFEVAGLPYVAEDALYNLYVAFAYPSFAANFRGWMGFTAAYGGGINTSSGALDYYPSTLAGLYDPANPTPSFWTYDVVGNANASAWGDYTTTRPLYPSALPFLVAVGTEGASGNILIGEYIFDRGRDHGAYLMWNHP